MRSFTIIVAVDEKLGIGKNGQLPWHLSSDLKHFKEITMKTSSSDKKNAVIMGRITWESLAPKYQPLPGRLNIVLTSNALYELPDGVVRCANLKDALILLDADSYRDAIDEIFVIGGGKVFQEAIAYPACERLYLTRIHKRFDCDIFFPNIPSRFKISDQEPHLTENSLEFSFETYIHP